jgi:hypothetical protein
VNSIRALAARLRPAAAFGLIALLTALASHTPAAAQVLGSREPRTLTIPGGHGRPGLTVRVSASGARGRIEIRGTTGLVLQTLACPLLRDESQPATAELAAVREQFVARFEVEDLNFDGYPDLKAPREFGAKWARYCVWLFDPASRTFMRNTLAEQLELLYNLQADHKHSRIIAGSISPDQPLVDQYRIEATGASRPFWPRLIPVESCFVDNSVRPAAVVVIRYLKGAAVATRELKDPSTDCGLRNANDER